MIPFTGLKDGKHLFDFSLDDRFFEAFEESEVKKGNLEVRIGLIKNPRFLELHFSLKGKAQVMCDRCLDYFDMPVEYEDTLYFRFGEETYEQSENVIILSSRESEIDVSQYLYEFTHLSLPYRKVHPVINGESTCNKSMVEQLNKFIVENKRPDPGWDQLKAISDKN